MTTWTIRGEECQQTLGAFTLKVWTRQGEWWMSLPGVITRHQLAGCDTLEQAKVMATEKAISVIEPAYKAAMELRHEMQVGGVTL